MRVPIFVAAIIVGAVIAISPAASAQPLLGTVEQVAFTGPITGRTVNFNIYLPLGYSSSTQHYPVVLHLHGIGGNQGGQQNTTVPASFETALAQGIIGPVIVVFPNGYNNSWWADSVGGDKPAETDVVQQVIPYVDAHYRTIPDRGARVIEGFSMGGFGAAKFYSKFPELFACCVEYDGAIVTWPVMLQFHASDAASIFGNSEATFNQYSPWYWTTQNADALGDGSPIRMVAGALVGGNRNFRDHLLTLDIPVDYVETGCAHEIGCLFSSQGQASAAFIAAALEIACPADFNNSGAVTSQDFFDFVTAFFSQTPTADFNHDGSVNSQDFFDFLAAFFKGC
jgi:endo-1,4-beta-xylanase